MQVGLQNIYRFDYGYADFYIFQTAKFRKFTSSTTFKVLLEALVYFQGGACHLNPTSTLLESAGGQGQSPPLPANRQAEALKKAGRRRRCLPARHAGATASRKSHLPISKTKERFWFLTNKATNKSPPLPPWR
jgi:hypothetical protein